MSLSLLTLLIALEAQASPPEDIPVIEAAEPRPIQDEGPPPESVMVPESKMDDESAADLDADAPKPGTWSGAFAGGYNGAFEEADPSFFWQVEGSYVLSQQWLLSLSQDLAQNVYVDAGNGQFELRDPRLGATRQIRVYGLKLRMSASVSLPFSTESRADEIYSLSRLGLGLSHAWTERLESSFGVSATYTLSRYQTASSRDGLGGEALPLMRFSFVHETGFQLTQRWSLSLSMVYSEILYQDVSYEGTGPVEIDKQPEQAYQLEAGLSYSPRSWATISLSYGQGSILRQAGFEDYVVFDDAVSSWMLGFRIRTLSK